MILAHRTHARLNPKNAKFHWFFNGFWIFTIGAKIGHMGPFGPSGGFDVDAALSTYPDFRKSYKFPIDFVQNVPDTDSNDARVASKMRARLETQIL